MIAGSAPPASGDRRVTTSRYRLSWQIRALGRESASNKPSSRSRFIGLTGTTIAPAFQAPTMPITK